MVSRSLLASLIAAIGFLAGCRRSIDEKLIGSWRLQGAPVDATFRADDTFTISTDNGRSTGTWRVEGNQLITIVPTSPSGKLIDTQTINVRGDEFVSYGTHQSVGELEGKQIGETEGYTLRHPIVYKRVK